jgi:hypothetical protein
VCNDIQMWLDGRRALAYEALMSKELHLTTMVAFVLLLGCSSKPKTPSPRKVSTPQPVLLAQPPPVSVPKMWHSLFDAEQTSTWWTSQQVTTTRKAADGQVAQTTTETISGKVNCRVEQVTHPTATLLRSFVSCDYLWDYEFAPQLQGTWETDGHSLWFVENTSRELRMSAPPSEKVLRAAEPRITISLKPATDDWCYSEETTGGDKSVMCFSAMRGLYDVMRTGNRGDDAVEVTTWLVAP